MFSIHTYADYSHVEQTCTDASSLGDILCMSMLAAVYDSGAVHFACLLTSWPRANSFFECHNCEIYLPPMSVTRGRPQLCSGAYREYRVATSRLRVNYTSHYDCLVTLLSHALINSRYGMPCVHCLSMIFALSVRYPPNWSSICEE